MSISWRKPVEKMPEELRKLIDERDNDAIIKYLESPGPSSKENFKVIIK